MQKRCDYIDVMRGIGIFLVVFAHVAKPITESKLILWIYSFHMPLFFFISGMVHRSSTALTGFLKKKFRSIVVPYFFWAVLSFLYWVLLERRFRAAESQIDVLDGLLGIVDGKYEHLMFNAVLWFLPVLFLVSVTFELLLRIKILDSKKNFVIFIIVIVLSYAGIIFFEESWVWGFNKMLRYMTFYAAGYYLKTYKIDEKIHNLKNATLFSVIVAIVFMLISYAMNIYGLRGGVWFYVVAIVGITLVFFVSILTENVAMLKSFGQNTMGILVMHGPLYRVLCVGIAYITQVSVEVLRNNYLFALVLSLITMGLLYIPMHLLDRYIPWVLGRKTNYKVNLMK